MLLRWRRRRPRCSFGHLRSSLRPANSCVCIVRYDFLLVSFSVISIRPCRSNWYRWRIKVSETITPRRGKENCGKGRVTRDILEPLSLEDATENWKCYQWIRLQMQNAGWHGNVWRRLATDVESQWISVRQPMSASIMNHRHGQR